jgi:hypothetical protein
MNRLDRKIEGTVQGTCKAPLLAGGLFFLVELDDGSHIKARVDGLPSLKIGSRAEIYETTRLFLKRYAFVRYIAALAPAGSAEALAPETPSELLAVIASKTCRNRATRTEELRRLYSEACSADVEKSGFACGALVAAMARDAGVELPQ